MKKRLDIRLADTNIAIHTDSEYLFNMCRNYTAAFECPDFVVEINDRDIEYEEQLFLERNNVSSAQSNLRYSVLESLAVYRKIAEKMIERDTVLFHGSAIAVDHNCYLFCADSGTGKSTHTRLWREYYKDRAVMINDDKPLIQIKDSQIRVFGTPWSGKHHLDTNTDSPLKAVCFLEQGTENAIMKITKDEALKELLRYSFHSSDPVRLQKSMALLFRMNELIPFYRLQCNMDPSACIVAYEGMNKNNAGDINE